MQVRLNLIECEYRDGLVIPAIGKPPLATTLCSARNDQELSVAAHDLLTPFYGRVDAVLHVVGYGRKFAQFDAVRRSIQRAGEIHKGKQA